MKSIHFIAKVNYYRHYASYLNKTEQIFYRNSINQKLLKIEKSFVIKDIKRLKFEVLNVFYIVVICGSICAASERLGMTQPAISLCLNKIEKEFGLKLFKSSKNTKFFKLTPPGLLLFNCIQRLLIILCDGISLSNSLQSLLLIKNQQNHNYILSNNKDSKKFLINNREFPYRTRTSPVELFRNSLKKELEFKIFDFRSKIFVLSKKNFYLKSKNTFSYDFKPTYLEFKKLHTHATIDPCEKHYIEIQTSNAFKTCSELDLSELNFNSL